MITLQPYLVSHAQLLKTQGDTFPETNVSTRAILLEIWPTLVKLARVIFFTGLITWGLELQSQYFDQSTDSQLTTLEESLNWSLKKTV